MRPTPLDVKNNIVALLKQGHSTRVVAKKLKIGKTTVQDIRQLYLSDLIIHTKYGHPSKLHPRNKQYCVREATVKGAETATEISKRLFKDIGVKVSRQTVARALHSFGLSAAEKVKKPRLSSQHIQNHLTFARKYKDWTIDD